MYLGVLCALCGPRTVFISEICVKKMILRVVSWTGFTEISLSVLGGLLLPPAQKKPRRQAGVTHFLERYFINVIITFLGDFVKSFSRQETVFQWLPALCGRLCCCRVTFRPVRWRLNRRFRGNDYEKTWLVLCDVECAYVTVRRFKRGRRRLTGHSCARRRESAIAICLRRDQIGAHNKRAQRQAIRFDRAGSGR